MRENVGVVTDAELWFVAVEEQVEYMRVLLSQERDFLGE